MEQELCDVCKSNNPYKDDMCFDCFRIRQYEGLLDTVARQLEDEKVLQEIIELAVELSKDDLI